MVVNGIHIPKGMILTPSASIMRDPEYWENPEDFDPERYLCEQLLAKLVHCGISAAQ